MSQPFKVVAVVVVVVFFCLLLLFLLVVVFVVNIHPKNLTLNLGQNQISNSRDIVFVVVVVVAKLG